MSPREVCQWAGANAPAPAPAGWRDAGGQVPKPRLVDLSATCSAAEWRQDGGFDWFDFVRLGKGTWSARS